MCNYHFIRMGYLGMHARIVSGMLKEWLFSYSVKMVKVAESLEI